MDRNQIEAFRAKQGVMVSGFGPCGAFAYSLEPGSEEYVIVERTYEEACQKTEEARDRLDSASNPVARFFAKRRHAEALEQQGKLLVPMEIDGEFELRQIRIEDHNG